MSLVIGPMVYSSCIDFKLQQKISTNSDSVDEILYLRLGVNMSYSFNY